MTLTPDVEQQLKRIYNKIRDTTSIGVGEPVKFMVQIEMLLGETADASSITGIVPLVHLQHDGATQDSYGHRPAPRCLPRKHQRVTPTAGLR